MKKIGFFVLFFAGGVALFWWTIDHIGWQEIFQAAQNFSFVQAVVILLLTLAMVIVGIWRWRMILGYTGYSLPLRKLSGLFLGGFGITYFVPMVILGGELFRAYALKEQHQIPFQKGLASVSIERILEITTNFFFGIIGLLVLAFQTETIPPKGVLALMAVALIFGIVILFFYFQSFRRESILHIFFRKRDSDLDGLEQDVLGFFYWKNRWLRIGFALSLLRSGIAFARTIVLIFFLTNTIELLPALSILGFYYIALLLPISALLGSHDALQAFAFQAFGLQPSGGAAFALIIRGVEFLVAIVGLIIVSVTGTRLFIRRTLGRVEGIVRHLP